MVSTHLGSPTLTKFIQLIETFATCFILCLLLIYLDDGVAKKSEEVEDYTDTFDDETFEQQSDAHIFYEDAVRHALQLLWKHRFHISMANFQLINVLGRNASETIKFREELHGLRDVIDRKSEELWNKLDKKLTLNEMNEPIEKSILDQLTYTWRNVTEVFDQHQPQNRTLEFTETYNWMQNIENNTSVAYRKVNWLMARIKKMRPVNQ